jgi:DDE superfamily endonuclease/helix-turn-helix, Psq domain/Tc5 transposase DNA-binding domain
MPRAKFAKVQKYRKYTILALKSALKAIDEDGLSINAAARAFEVPASTLKDKFNGKSEVGCKSGSPPVLGKYREEVMAQWIRNMARVGFPIRCLDLTETVKKMCIVDKIKNPFNNNEPGQSWVTGFFERHPDLKVKSAEHHSIGRAQVTEERIRGWFNTIHKNLRETGNMGILHDPRRWTNADEKPALLNPDGIKFIGVKGETTQSVETGGSSKEALTVLVSYNGVGEQPPQMVVFKMSRNKSTIEASIPEGWIMAKSDTGWVKSETFVFWLAAYYDWCVENDLLPLIPDELLGEDKEEERKIWGNNITLKMMLLIDGYAAHLSMEASIFCEERGIILYSLYPQATHILQPADVGAMSPLERNWGGELQRHKLHTGGKRVTKEEFTPLFKRAMDKVTTSTFVNSFRACGFLPLNPDAVRYDRLVSYQRKKVEEQMKQMNRGQGKQFNIIIIVFIMHRKLVL